MKRIIKILLIIAFVGLMIAGIFAGDLLTSRIEAGSL